MTAGQTMALSEQIPLPDEDRGAMYIAMVFSALFYGLIMWWGDVMNYYPGREAPIPSWMFFPGMLVLLVVFNLTPLARLSGWTQYVCMTVVMFGVLLFRETPAFIGGWAALATGSLVVGLFAFCAIRVNWWFLWQNTSARTLNERFWGSILYTSIFPLGMVMGFYRLLGVGRNEATTEFVTVGGKQFEALPENPELAQHKARREAIAKGRQMVAMNKDDISGTL